MRLHWLGVVFWWLPTSLFAFSCPALFELGAKAATYARTEIAPTAQPTLREEYAETGVVVLPGEWIELPVDEERRLVDGTYVFLIALDTNGRENVVWSHRTPDFFALETKDLLATHRSLRKRLRPGDRIVAAGEFRLWNSMVYKVTNRAGTYRGGIESLYYAAWTLFGFGLPIVPGRTLLVDLGAESDIVHAEAAFDGRLTVLFHRAPIPYAVKRVARNLVSRMAARWSRADGPPSTLDPAFLHVPEDFPYPAALSQAASLFALGETDGIEFALMRLIFSDFGTTDCDALAPLREHDRRHARFLSELRVKIHDLVEAVEARLALPR